MSYSRDMLTPKLIWGITTLSLTTTDSLLPWGRVAKPLISSWRQYPQCNRKRKKKMQTRNSANADKPELSIYRSVVPKMHRFWDIRLQKMSWPWNPGQRSLKVIRTDINRFVTYDFLLTLHSNHEIIPYHFWKKNAISVENHKFFLHPLCI